MPEIVEAAKCDSAIWADHIGRVKNQYSRKKTTTTIRKHLPHNPALQNRIIRNKMYQMPKKQLLYKVAETQKVKILCKMQWDAFYL